MARVHRFGAAAARRRAGALPARAGHRLHATLRRLPAVPAQYRICQHDRHRAGARVSRRPCARAPHRGLHPLERDGDGRAGEPAEFRVRRAHLDLRFRRHAVRSRLQSFLACTRQRPCRRHGVHAGALVTRHLCARVPRGQADRGPVAPLPRGSGRRRSLVVSAPVADAGLLAVPDGLDGPRPDDGDLPGALPALHGASRDRAAERPQGLVLPRRRRDGRAGVARRDHDAGAREARQPGVRHQLQPAAPGRAGARQRQDHPGTRGRVPRRRLERDQGDLGLALGSAARAGLARAAASPDDGMRRRRVPELQGEGRRVHARELLRQVCRAEGTGRQHVGRRHLAVEPRRPRRAQGLQCLCRRRGAQGPAHGDPREDRQGLRHGPRGRRPEHLAPAEEAGRRGAEGVPRPLQHPGVGRRHRARAVLPAGGGQRGTRIPARAAQVARRLPAAAAHARRRSCRCPGSRRSGRCSSRRAIARSRPRWRS